MKKKYLLLIPLSFLLPMWLFAHHFKGLPHFNYFENYPQIPQDEFLAMNDQYEFSLVIYDFQGITKSDNMQPNDVRLYLAIYNLSENTVYNKSLEIHVLDGDRAIKKVAYEHSEEESVYTLNLVLPETGQYSLQVITMIDNVVTKIPFVLSSQKTSYEIWVASLMLLVLIFVIYGARRARIKQDRIDNLKTRKVKAKHV